MQKNISQTPTIAVSIVTWNSSAEIKECLQALKALPENWEVWIADNNSADETVNIIKNEFPFVNLIANADNKGFAEANNQIIDATVSDYVLLFNPDAIATAEQLCKCLELIESNPKIDVLGVRLVNEDESLQTSCFHFPTFWKNFVDAFDLYRIYSTKQAAEIFAGECFAHDEARKVDWVMGAFMFFRRSAIEKAGKIPEDYFMFAEDLDFCWQITKNGGEIWFSPEVSIVHKLNKSAGQLASEWRVERTTLSKYLFCRKNFGFITSLLIQLTDLLGVNYKIFRKKLKEPDSKDILEWKSYRKVIMRSIFMSKKQIQAKLSAR
ncbi:MAG TPA: glycosyltransferase family 2 protein [Pyrinomonadaceae bacterium]|nr:glycosyltransferase family 2 protein [Pyrinomonadaceae bacterium]